MAQTTKRTSSRANRKTSHTRPLGGKRAGAGRWGSGPLQCTTCKHPERGRIDFLLAGGAGLNAVARQFGIPKESLSGHYQKHVSDRYKKMVAAQHAPTFDELLAGAVSANAQTIDTLNMIVAGHSSRWAICLEAGDDRNLATHSQRILQAIEMRARITLELQPEARNLTVNNYLVRDAAQLVATLRDNADAVRKIEEWYETHHDEKLIEHVETQGSAD